MLKEKKDSNFSLSYPPLRLSKGLFLLFTFYLIICMFFASILVFYHYSNNIILERVKKINAAVARTDDFFNVHKDVLQHLTQNIIILKNHEDTIQEKVNIKNISIIPLNNSEEAKQYGLLIFKRDLEMLNHHQLQLVYTSRLSQKTTVLYPQNQAGTMPKELADKIDSFLNHQPLTYGSNSPPTIIWLNLKVGDETLLYFYLPIDNNNPDAGWLGIGFRQFSAWINHVMPPQGNYYLLDKQGVVVLPRHQVAHDDSFWLNQNTTDSFSVVRYRLIPKYLILRQPIGQGGWSLVYSVSIVSLMQEHFFILTGMILVTISLFLSVILLFFFLSRKVLRPALQQYAALQDSEALNRQLVETVSVGLLLVNEQNSELLFANELALGWIKSDPVRYLRTVISRTPAINNEWVLHDGRTVQIRCISTSWRDTPAILYILNDISTLKSIEHSLLAAKSIADAENQAKTLFLTTMSHEIRTPLYGILGTLELFKMSSLNEQQNEYISMLLHSSSSLLRIVDDSLDLSSIEAGKLPLDIAPFSPMELVELVVTSYASKAESKGLHIYAITDTQVPYLLQGDALRIRQILDNLVNNAVKFTLSGHIILRIKFIQNDEEVTRLSFNVIDSGPGISPQYLPYIFEPYFRSTKDNIATFSGSGLGLSICARLAQMMGGTLNVVSELGLGTQFNFEASFPLAHNEAFLPPLTLLPEDVYIDGAIPEVVDNLCHWLRFWGAEARPMDTLLQAKNMQSVRVTTWPPPPQPTPWNGKHIIALPPTLHSTQPQKRNTMIVSAYSVIAIGRLLQSMQQNSLASIAYTNNFITDQFDLRILILDDNVVNRIVLQEQMELFGCEVVQVSNGQDAINTRDIHTFDAVFTDLNMPFINGYEVAIILRELHYTGKIIALTGNTTHQEGKNSDRPIEIDSLLLKPLSLKQLRSVLFTIPKNRG